MATLNKKQRAKPTRNTLSVTQMASGFYDLKTGKKFPPAVVKAIQKKRRANAKKMPQVDGTIDLGDDINELDWVMSHSGGPLGDLRDDLEMWLEELQELLDRGDDLGIDEHTDIDNLKWNGPYYRFEQEKAKKNSA